MRLLCSRTDRVADWVRQGLNTAYSAGDETKQSACDDDSPRIVGKGSMLGISTGDR
jgi:hypothetical protein